MDSLISLNHYKEISSVVIAHNGKVIFENYYNHNNSETKHNTRSATKTITGTLIGTLIQNGLIKSVNENASKFSKIKNLQNPDDRKDKITIEDLLKIGQLYLNNGKWNEEQIISEEFVKKSTEPHAEVGMLDYEFGYLWWLSKFGKDQKEKAYFMSGTSGNKIAIFPELDMVVVLTSTYYNGGMESHNQTTKLLNQYIVLEIKKLNK